MKKKYQILIEFLDNTIIRAPTKRNVKSSEEQKTMPKLPHYERLPSIGDSTPEAYSPTKTHRGSRVTFNLTSSPDSITYVTDSRSANGSVTDTQSENYTVKSPETNELTSAPAREVSSFSVWSPPNDIKNFCSLIEVPTAYFQELEESQDPEDQTLLEKELEVLEVFKRVEIVYALHMREELNGEIMLTEAVESLLSDESVYHIFFQVFKLLRTAIQNAYYEGYKYILLQVHVSTPRCYGMAIGEDWFPPYRISDRLWAVFYSGGSSSGADKPLITKS